MRRQVGLAWWTKAGSGSSCACRQRHPGLDAEEPGAARFTSVRGALGMDDAAPGRHPVDLARADGHLRAEAVAVHDLAIEQIGHGRKPDVRVRAHVDALPSRNSAGPIWSKKMKGPTICLPCAGSARRTSKAAEVARTRHDHLLDRRGTSGRRPGRDLQPVASSWERPWSRDLLQRLGDRQGNARAGAITTSRRRRRAGAPSPARLPPPNAAPAPRDPRGTRW